MYLPWVRVILFTIFTIVQSLRVVVTFLGVSLNKDDADLNLELTGHGVSNLIAGFMGYRRYPSYTLDIGLIGFLFGNSVPSNYLAYVNSLL
jgi:hypothetical protein